MYLEYGRYYQAQALFQGDIDAWEKWNKLLVRQLKQAQKPDGSFQGQFGPTLSTSMSLLALALNYRFLTHLRAVDHAHAQRADRRIEARADRCTDFLPPRVAVASPALLWSIADFRWPPAAVLHLRNGGFVSGELTDSRQPNVVRWQATAFVSPFEFAAQRINGRPFSRSARTAPADGRLLLRARRRRRRVRRPARTRRQRGRDRGSASRGDCASSAR